MSKLDWDTFEQEALKKLKSGGQLGGKDGVMAPLIKHLLETALSSEFYTKVPSITIRAIWKS